MDLSPQLLREQEMADRGQHRAQSKLDWAVARDASSTPAGVAMARRAIRPVAEALTAFLTAAFSGRPGRRHVAANFLRGVDADLAAFVSIKAVVHSAVRRNSLKAAALAAARHLEIELIAAEFTEQNNALYQSILRNAKNRGLSQERQGLAVREGAVKFDLPTTRWSRREHLLVGTKLVELVIENTDIVEVRTLRQYHHTRYELVLTEAADKWFLDYNHATTLTRPFYLPMLTKPQPWEAVEGSPYWGGALRGHLIAKASKDHRKLLEEGDMSVVFRALNGLQDTPWRTNERVLAVMKEAWERDAGLSCLPSREDIPIPEHIPDDVPNAGRGSQLRKEWRRRVRDIHDANAKMRSYRFDFSRTISIAEDNLGETIYFPYNLDFRGRTYAGASAMTPQSADPGRGLLEFAEGKKLGENGLWWLGIHGANLFGIDKVSFAERYGWAIHHARRARAVANDPLGNLWWTEADKPWCALAWCFEWADVWGDLSGTVQRREAYVSHLPIALDGSCNGIQHFSAMLLDEIGGAAVNLTASDKPQDIYQRVADRVNELLEVKAPGKAKPSAPDHAPIDSTYISSKDTIEIPLDTQRGHEEDRSSPAYLYPFNEDVHEDDKDDVPFRVTNPYEEEFLATGWRLFGIDRKITKRPVMVLPYGGTFRSCVDYVRQAVREQIAGGKENPFGEDLAKAEIFLAKKVWEAIDEIVIGAREVMRFLQECARAAGNVPLTWTTPSGFVAYQNYQGDGETRVKTRFMGSIIKYREPDEKAPIDTRRQALGISPNFVHSMDASALMLTVNACLDVGITNFAMIHDSYGTHAADTDTLARLLRETFVKMYEDNDVLAQLREGLASTLPPNRVADLPDLPMKRSLDLKEVLSSQYFFA